MLFARLPVLSFVSLAALAGCVAPEDAPPDHVDGDEIALSADACPVADGVDHGGRRRFLYGLNYAWDNFGADFGGLAKWGQVGVSKAPGAHASVLADMKAHGANVVRWWIMPDLRGDAVVFDSGGKIVGLGGTAVADVKKALELAKEADVYLMLCLFSFDAFRPTYDAGGGVRVEDLAPIVRDKAQRKALIDKVIRPLAKAVQASPHRGRLHSWDIINEPEWAMKGKNPYGDPPYDSMPGLDPVDHGQMEVFVKDVLSALRQETPGVKLTVGSAAVKWSHAWKHVGLDYYQVHWYDWVDASYPHSSPPESYGLDDKPVVVGEFPVGGMSNKAFSQLSAAWLAAGYAGALGWDYALMDDDDAASMKSFSAQHPCETSYSKNTQVGGACTDVAPDNTYTCAQQASWGKCNEPWMAGKCDKTCGRCGGACVDVAPDGNYTCAQQASWGKCNEPWMAGKCEKTCGHCK